MPQLTRVVTGVAGSEKHDKKLFTVPGSATDAPIAPSRPKHHHLSSRINGLASREKKMCVQQNESRDWRVFPHIHLLLQVALAPPAERHDGNNQRAPPDHQNERPPHCTPAFCTHTPAFLPVATFTISTFPSTFPRLFPLDFSFENDPHSAVSTEGGLIISQIISQSLSKSIFIITKSDF